MMKIQVKRSAAGIPSCILLLTVAVSLGGGSKQTAAPHGLPFDGEEAENFLKIARVLKMKSIPVGVTLPQQATVTDGVRTARAVWKTIDEHSALKHFEGGGFEVGFSDSYKHEIAAYELDKLLDLRLVPPTVERRIRNKWGSLQLWVEGSITERERMKRNLRSKNLRRWNEQMYKVRLLHQLTYNTDFNNIRNILVDPDFRIYAIDNSRAFRVHHKLLAERDLKRFSRLVLERLRGLRRELLRERLGQWLTDAQIEALLKRRDLILARAERLIAEQGEKAVLYP